ncbi:MAG: hypothetical protein HPY50_06270 [Firmicutes bacterium]|nr:hypothetical protein [Bacillota bacterium]
MKPKVGIPRALFYYYLYPAWEAFFTSLGAEVVLSSRTHKGIVNSGVTTAVDEACLPVKVYYGHVLDLAGRVDYLFLPRLVSIEPRAYICPKFMGLPDMIKANLDRLPKVIDWCVDVSRSDREYRKELLKTARLFTSDRRIIRQAEAAARERLGEYSRLLELGWLPEEAISMLTGQREDSGNRDEDQEETRGERLRIAILGHAYTLYDEYVSHQVISKLQQLGVKVTTPEMLPEELIETEARRLPKRMFWTLGKKIIGAAFHFLDSGEYDGIIHLACFGCGPDSLVAELVAIEAQRRKQPPFMMLTLDEHTGEAGTVTRLEAFVDLVQRSRHMKQRSATV